MKWLRTSLILMLVALWALASNHCRLEIVAELGALVCCPHDDTSEHHEDDCDTDGCAQLENALYKSEDSGAAITAPVFASVDFLTAELPRLARQPSSWRLFPHFTTVAPPESLATWNFSLRAASTPRAPAFAS